LKGRYSPPLAALTGLLECHFPDLTFGSEVELLFTVVQQIKTALPRDPVDPPSGVDVNQIVMSGSDR
jgi:hypothetical protein